MVALFSSQPAVRVDPPVFVIGDVHGCHDLLLKMLDQVPEGAEVLQVGDMIDRGPYSRAVVETLRDRPQITCLTGNHEDMCLKFLDDPSGKAARWLQHGGRETLASYGVDPETEPRAAARALSDAMGQEVIDWLRSRPAFALRGNVAITHAGADPALPIDDAQRTSLIWGHPDTGKHRRDNLWVLLGHQVVPDPRESRASLLIDTGAYATDRLSAAHLTAEGCRFVTVTR